MESVNKQGDSLNPFLFIMIIDEIIKKVSNRNGHKMRQKEDHMLC